MFERLRTVQPGCGRRISRPARIRLEQPGATGAPGIEIEGRFRGRGLGREAMLLVEQEARRRGFVEIRLNVFGGNETARSLYRSLRYVEFAIGMRKRLS